MSAELILRNDSALTIAFTKEAENMRALALESSALIGRVNSPESQTVAVDAMKMIKITLKQVEESRVAVKGPVLEYCRQIDALAREFVEDLKAEELRLAKVIGDYQAEQLAITRRQEAERQAEIRRIEEEQQAALLKAEQARQAELAAVSARNREALLKEQEGQRLAEESRQAELAKQKMEALPPPAAPPKASGQVIREVFLFEVVDIWLLARKTPGLVRIEPNKQEINELLARGVREIAGLRVYQQVKSGVRIGPTSKAIDV